MDDSSVRGAEDKRFQVLLHVILIIFTACAVLPFVLLVSSSFTDDATLVKFGYNFWPRQFSIVMSPVVFCRRWFNVVKFKVDASMTVMVMYLGNVFFSL